MSRKIYTAALPIAFAFLVASHFSFAQGVGASISGIVHDSTGASLPAAQVVIKNVETGTQREVVTDDSGRYSAASLPVGIYEVRVQKEGFTPQTKGGIQLVVGESASVDITLPVGEVRQ